MEQRTAEWFDARKDKITASNVGAILELSPYKTPGDVMREMVRFVRRQFREFTGNAATQWGVDNEPHALAALGLETGEFIERCGFIVHPDHPWLGASPDGLINDDTVVEAKCPYNQTIFTLNSRADYMAQMQIQMACAGRQRGLFCIWTPSGCTSTEVDYDSAWFSGVIGDLKSFHDNYLAIIEDSEKAAPYLDDKVVDMDNNKEWLVLAAQYISAKEDAEAAKKRLDETKKLLIDMANGSKSAGAGVMVYPIKGRTTTDYKTVIKNHCPDVDLSEYQKQGRDTWGVR